jgi:hypothetical protein
MFCEAGDRHRGQEMLLKASECYKKKRIWFSAAKAVDQAIILAQEEVSFPILFVYDLLKCQKRRIGSSFPILFANSE